MESLRPGALSSPVYQRHGQSNLTENEARGMHLLPGREWGLSPRWPQPSLLCHGTAAVSRFPASRTGAGLVTRFDRENAPEVTLCTFWSQVLTDSAPTSRNTESPR